ncbi:MAG: prepilin peptidase [Lachnospiraceae bacterium]|nr:prepilin peptidase [Lachnospiraceae bacterium]
MTNTFNLILHGSLLLYLIWSAIIDIRTRTISRKMALYFSIIITIAKLSLTPSASHILSSCLPGLCFLLIGILTKQALGYGDGIVVLIIGFALGLPDTIMIILIAFFSAAIISIILLIARKNKRYSIPFVPFLLWGHILQLICTHFTS